MGCMYTRMNQLLCFTRASPEKQIRVLLTSSPAWKRKRPEPKLSCVNKNEQFIKEIGLDLQCWRVHDNNRPVCSTPLRLGLNRFGQNQVLCKYWWISNTMMIKHFQCPCTSQQTVCRASFALQLSLQTSISWTVCPFLIVSGIFGVKSAELDRLLINANDAQWVRWWWWA